MGVTTRIERVLANLTPIFDKHEKVVVSESRVVGVDFFKQKFLANF